MYFLNIWYLLVRGFPGVRLSNPSYLYVRTNGLKLKALMNSIKAQIKSTNQGRRRRYVVCSGISVCLFVRSFGRSFTLVMSCGAKPLSAMTNCQALAESSDVVQWHGSRGYGIHPLRLL